MPFRSSRPAASSASSTVALPIWEDQADEAGLGDEEVSGAYVVAVLIAHDGQCWLPEALAALRAQTRPPDRVVCVDTGSTDATPQLLAECAREPIGDDRPLLLTVPRETGFGVALQRGLLAADAIDGANGQGAPAWLWVLHDDCAPEPECLGTLLAAAATPAVGVLGPKALDWDDPRLLVEVGLSADTTGRRETGLERRELDQGQHDDVGDVLAVGSAGMLVRRQCWDELAGLDGELPLSWDDIDFGWRANLADIRVRVVPAARLRHAHAVTTGRRPVDCAPGTVAAIDRRHGLFTVVANTPRARLIWTVPQLVVAGLVHALARVLTRRFTAAGIEVAALGHVAGAPGRLLAARRRRASLRRVPYVALRPLLVGRAARLRGHLAAVADALSGGATSAEAPPETATRETGPSEESGDLVAAGPRLRGALLRPGVLLVVVLAVVALLAERALLGGGGGRLVGGSLLAAPAGASDLWSAYLDGWHPSGLGTDAAAPPYLAVLAAVATVTFGKAWLAVDLLLLASVPLAGLMAYRAAVRVVRSPLLRVWGAATYALLPAATGAIAGGRLGVAVAFALLPGLLTVGARVLGDDPRRSGWWRAFAGGVGLAVAVAFAPQLYLFALVLVVGGIIAVALRSGPAAVQGVRRRAVAGGILLAVPLLALLPWSVTLLREPSLVLLGPDGAGGISPAVAVRGWDLVLLSPGGPGLPALGVTAGLLLAALAGLMRSGRRTVSRTGWGIAGVGLLAAVLVAAGTVSPAGGAAARAGWPGLAVALAGAGLVLAALVAGERGYQRLSHRSFGWRQPAALVVAAAAALTPLLAGTAWVARGADGPLQRESAVVLPAFVTAEVPEPGRVLFLEAGHEGVGYTLASATGPRLGTDGLAVPAEQRELLTETVSALVTGAGDAGAVAALVTYGVRYVALPAPASDSVGGVAAAALDATPGLSRRPHDGSVRLWEVRGPIARVSVLPATAASAALDGSAPERAAVAALSPRSRPALGGGLAVGDGEAGRLLVVTAAADDGWQARLNGEPLTPRVAWGWAQAFTLPAQGGRIEIDYDQSGRHGWIAVQSAVLLVVAILAAPGTRRDGDPGLPIPRQPAAAPPVEAARRSTP